ncbi:RecX family transcriptional regulator [Thermomicrobium sp. 4228-Ro]|uniref:regulatory protein RecX n=1 Tax=Thermomicrobium sp. 4228-Ro TaxID=2993937 RepID=UPI0022492A88|nr:RecX family transcriptional regulator [Thermomicrobium sp. 4228-Ro]MCX2727492.1 RecX family transcriptional regulator [Thermomicrobium sp. 4228-Ro]
MAEVEQRITRLAPHPRRADRFVVERDGEPWLLLSAARVAELGIVVGERLTSERVAAIERAGAVDAAMDIALRALASRPRSEAELAQRLRQEGTAEDIVAEVLSRLRHLGYLDDRAFAEAWVTQRRRFSPRGAAALRRELRVRGVAPEIIDAVVGNDSVDDLEAARAVAQKHWHRLQRLDRAVAERRLIGVLQRRGFSWSVIHRVVKSLLEAEGEE